MKNRKGFTIVELVIVIAVIAILASVLVPTFSDVILKAKRSADTQVVRMLNEYVSVDLAGGEKTKHESMYDAIQACVDNGMSPEKISAKSDYNIAWESTSGNFVLIDSESKIVIYPLQDYTNAEYSINGNEIDYFVVTTYDNRVEEDPTFKYSVYAYGNDWPSNIKIHTGFDVGNVEFDSITYETAAVQIVNIRTTINTKLIIQAANSTINHFDESYLIDINTNNYHEYGIVGRLKVNETTNIELMNYSEVFCLMNENTQNNNLLTNDYAVVHGDNNILNLKDDSGIAHSMVSICSSHDINANNKVLSIDNKDYSFCLICGVTFSKYNMTEKLDSNNEATGARYKDASPYYCVFDSKNKKCLTHGTEVSKYSNTKYCYCDEDKTLTLFGDKDGVVEQCDNYDADIYQSMQKAETLVLSKTVTSVDANVTREPTNCVLGYDQKNVNIKTVVYESLEGDIFSNNRDTGYSYIFPYVLDYYYFPNAISWYENVEHIYFPEEQTIFITEYILPNTTDIVIPKNIIDTCDYMFACNREIRSVTFEEGSQIKYIERGMFECSSLKYIQIPSSVEVVYNWAFSDCYDLVIDVLNPNTYFESYSISYCPNIVINFNGTMAQFNWDIKFEDGATINCLDGTINK